MNKTRQMNLGRIHFWIFLTVLIVLASQFNGLASESTPESKKPDTEQKALEPVVETSSAWWVKTKNFINETYWQSNWYIRVLIVVLLYLALSVLILFFSILILRYFKTKKRMRINNLRNQFKEDLAAFLFDDDFDQSNFQGITHIVNRSLLVDEMRDLHSNLHGESADKLRQLYYDLSLHKDSIARARSNKWSTKAKGFRELAQMDIKDINDYIYQYVDYKNPVIRMEAQVALVKLSESEPLGFLYNLETDLSYWEQVNIYDSLVYHQIVIDSFEPWLENSNPSVIIFAIRMIGLFKHVQSAEKIKDLLKHENQDICLAAVQTMGKLELPEYVAYLQELYEIETENLQQMLEKHQNENPDESREVKTLEDLLPRKIRYEAVKAIGIIAGPDDLDFLINVIYNTDSTFRLRLLATQTIASIPGGLNKLDTLYEKSDDVVKSMIANVKQNLES